MNILLVTYYYGHTASGVISKRVAEQLSSKGNNVVVLAQSAIQSTGDNNVIINEVKNPLRRNSIFLRIMRRMEECALFYYFDWFWVRIAARKARNIIENNKPDIIYCRTSPVDACYVGAKLQQKYSIPVFQHFSDPVPPPYEYLPSSKKRRVLEKKITSVIKHATAVSFGNEYMQKYVLGILGLPMTNKVFVSPDMSSGNKLRYADYKDDDVIRIVYYGNIYGGRNPKPLYDALSQLVKRGYSLELQVYSNVEKTTYEQYPFITRMSFTANTFEALAAARILVDLDGDDSDPVFISSKLKDYLLINRPIISITPKDSPSANILKDLSSVFVVENKVIQIQQAIERLINQPLTDSVYKDREALISYFSPETVSNGLLLRMKQ